MKRIQRRSLSVFWTVLLFFYVPILVLVVNSFNKDRFSGAWKGFTLDWYALLFDSEKSGEIWHALGNTLEVAAGATLASVVLGTLAALALSRYKGRIQAAHYGLLYTHLVLPDVLMGISLLLFFISVGMGLSLFTVFLAHTTFCVSYVAMAVLARLEDFDNATLEAASDLGANAWQTFWKVQFPMLLPGIVAGGLLAFTLSIDGFVITFFVAGQGSDTLPVKIYGMIRRSRNLPVINALSTLMMCVTVLAVVATRMMQGRGARAVAPSSSKAPVIGERREGLGGRVRRDRAAD